MPTLKNVKRSLYMGVNKTPSIVLKSDADSWAFDPSFDKDEMEKTCSITITLPVKEQPKTNPSESSIVLKSGADSGSLLVTSPLNQIPSTSQALGFSTSTITLEEQPKPNLSESKSSHLRWGHWEPHHMFSASGGSNLPPVWGLTAESAKLPLSTKEDNGDTKVYNVKLIKKAEDTATSTDTDNIKTWKIVVVDSSETEKKYAIKVNGHTEWMLGADEKTTMVVLRKASEDDTRFHWHIK